MTYQPLLSLKLTHPYYADSRCPDFDIVPHSRTERWLRDQRAVLRTQSDGFIVLVETTARNVPLIPLSDTNALRFKLMLRNPEAALYTEFPPFWKPVYRNADGAHMLEPHEPEPEPKPKPLPKALPGSTALSPTSFSSVILTHRGKLTDTPVSYEIMFQPKTLRWVYVLVAPSNGASFAISSSGSTFAAYAHQSCEPPLTSIDAVATALTRQFSNKKVICLASNERLTVQQTVRKSIELRKDQAVIVKHLSNPQPHHIANLGTESVLYEIVKLFSEASNS